MSLSHGLEGKQLLGLDFRREPKQDELAGIGSRVASSVSTTLGVFKW